MRFSSHCVPSSCPSWMSCMHDSALCLPAWNPDDGPVSPRAPPPLPSSLHIDDTSMETRTEDHCSQWCAQTSNRTEQNGTINSRRRRETERLSGTETLRAVVKPSEEQEGTGAHQTREERETGGQEIRWLVSDCDVVPVARRTTGGGLWNVVEVVATDCCL